MINLPFGFWRAGQRKLSGRWFVAVHAPVLLAVGLRLWLGVGLSWNTVPVLAGSFALGQWLGGDYRRRQWPTS